MYKGTNMRAWTFARRATCHRAGPSERTSFWTGPGRDRPAARMRGRREILVFGVCRSALLENPPGPRLGPPGPESLFAGSAHGRGAPTQPDLTERPLVARCVRRGGSGRTASH